MSARHDLALTRGWTADGTRLVVEALEALDDDALAGPSLLPGWSRAHVVAHLARNAEALGRLATWARTGEELPMYADAQQRDADIAASAQQAPADLRHDVAATAAELEQAFAALDGAAWDARVRVRQGDEVPARVLPWLRVRELWLHAVDLDAGADLAGAPGPLLDELAADLTATLSRRDGCPAVELRPRDRPGPWHLGEDPDDGARTTVEGSAADLVVWLAGRGGGAGVTAASGPLPALPAWL
ncbi:maleylpyruvate isomerase family mycothiol-dependent enzyme [Aquipuribacter hungaricus]|uniref:Maleylpyruvate isomerase family mycothiol-dependent enzyme n=1 Tax=Aquipuribacter hungaricus TaxID=545624 RepID=A0ABV7WLE2_9MICO